MNKAEQSFGNKTENHNLDDSNTIKLNSLLMVLLEQVDAMKSKGELLASLGLTHTSGYIEAVTAYDLKLKAYLELKTKLGV